MCLSDFVCVLQYNCVCVCVQRFHCVCVLCFQALSLAPALGDEFMSFFIFESLLITEVSPSTGSHHQLPRSPPDSAEQTFRGAVSSPQDVSRL